MLVAQKEAAKNALLIEARALYARVQAATNVSDAQKVELNIHIRKTTPTPVPAPSAVAQVVVESVAGHTAKMRVIDPANPMRRSKPAGVSGVAWFSHVGPTPPADLSGWTFQGNSGKLEAEINFASSLAPGTMVWFTSFFFNPRKQSGPAGEPTSALIQFGGVSMAA